MHERRKPPPFNRINCDESPARQIPSFDGLPLYLHLPMNELFTCRSGAALGPQQPHFVHWHDAQMAEAGI